MAPKKAVPKRGGGAVVVEPTVSASSSAAMDAKKPFRGLMAQFSAISHVVDRDLLTALLSIFSDIRKIPTTEAPALIAALRGEHLSMEVMVEPLLHNRCVRSSLPSVAEVVGWILCDVVRLHRAVVGEGGATSDAHPFPRSSCDDVVGCIIAPFEALVEQQKQKGSASLHKCEGIIERAAAARVFSALLPACLRTETTARLEACFEAVRAASSSRSGSGGAGNNNNTNNAGTTTAGTAAEMARMLNDILDATHAITVEQLRPLLEEIIRASPMLREVANNNSSSTSTSRSLAASVPARTGKDLGAVIAARVLMEQRDLIQPAIASYVMEVLRSGLEELRGVGDATGDASLERKRRGLKSVAYALELLIALMELETALVRSLVERLAPLLRHEEQEVRQLLLRGVSSALLSNEGALAAYPAAFHESLARLADPKPPIRMEAVVFLGKLMERATRLWSASPAAADRWRRLWGTTVQPQLNQALIDAHYLVRRQAVHTYCDILLAPLSAPHSLLTFVDDDDGTTTLSRTLGRRTADLHPKVRQTAVECLAALYGRLPCAWIPGAVMQTLRAEGGIHTVEVCWELMLPTERGATNTSSPSSSSSLANTQPRLTSHSTLAATAEMAVFEFEKQQLLQERSYAEAWASLCADLPDSSFAQLLTMAKKKPQLRRAIQRLFELRSDIKAAVDPRAETSQAIIHNIQRLLVFLAGITHATKGEWDELFRSKDEKVGKALLLACEPQNINWIDVRADLLARLHGRLETDVQSFMEGSLAKQLMMPFQLAHIEELLSRISAAFAAAREAAMSEEEAAAAITKCAPSTALHMLGMIRAVLICTATSPSFWGYTDALRVLMEAMVQLHHMHVGVVGMSGWLAVAQLLMHALMEWAGLGEDLSLGISHTSCLAKVPAEVRKGVVEVLVALSHGQLSASTTAQAAGDEEVGYAAAARLGKRAARTLLALLRVRGMGEAQTICTALSEDLHTQLHRSNPHQQGTSCTSSLAILHAVRALAGDPLTAPLMRDATLANDLRRWLRTALAEDGPDAAAETAKIRSTRHSSTATATGSGEGLELPMEDELITSAGVLSQTASGAVVEACAKALVAVALNAVASDRPDAISSTIAEFLAGYKVACARPIHAVGGARRRLALGQQLLKLVRLPSANMAQELSVAMIISSEDCPVVRQCLQRKLAHHLLHGTCDMRYAALLLLTAVSEESRASFQLLRQLVRRVGDHLRAKQAATVMQLSDPAALYCFLEYSIPFLTLFMAHHPMYESERSTGFIAYQRTWHLLMEELFRHNTACGSVVVELLNRIKQADDVLEPESNATRVLCDLGSVVMHACLSQHQCSVESLRRYPGKLLLPSFYTAANRPDRLTTAYLDPSFRAAPNAPFTRTATTTTTTTAAHNQDELQQSLSRGTSPSATPEMAASSTPRNARKTMRTTTPSTTPAKRSRSEGTSCASPRAAVDRVLDGLFAGLRRPQIAALRWKTVKAAIDAALAAQPAAAVEDEGSTEMILGYAKEQLRQRYEHAEP